MHGGVSPYLQPEDIDRVKAELHQLPSTLLGTVNHKLYYIQAPAPHATRFFLTSRRNRVVGATCFQCLEIEVALRRGTILQ